VDAIKPAKLTLLAPYESQLSGSFKLMEKVLQSERPYRSVENFPVKRKLANSASLCKKKKPKLLGSKLT